MKNKFEGDNFYCEIVYDVGFEQYTISLYRKSDHCLVLEIYCADGADAVFTAKRVWTNAETFKTQF
jgi:hypothetical protein